MTSHIDAIKILELLSDQMKTNTDLLTLIEEQSKQIDALAEHVVNVKRRVVALEKRIGE